MAGRERALIVGAGAGLSAAIARRCAGDGMDLVLAARNTQKLADLARETGAAVVACDATSADQVDRLFATIDSGGDRLDLVVYNASGRARGPVVELDPAAVEQAIRVTAFGGFLVARAAAQRMVKQGHGTILFTGASASVKGYARSSSFAMGKFALRGLAESYFHLYRQQRSAWAWEIELRPWVETF